MLQPDKIPGKLVAALLEQAENMIDETRLHDVKTSHADMFNNEVKKTLVDAKLFDGLLQKMFQGTDQALSLAKLGQSIEAKDFGSYGRALYSSPTWEQWSKTCADCGTYLGLRDSQIKLSATDAVVVLSFASVNNRATALDYLRAGLLLKLFFVSKGNKSVTKIGLCEPLVSLDDGAAQLSNTQTNAVSLLSFEFPRKSKRDKPRLANMRVHSVFVKDMLTDKEQEAQHPVAFEVQQLIESQSDLSHVNQSWVASQLHTSERNLLRKIKQANTSFRDLFNRVRSKRSLELLFTGMSIAKIGQLLGYSERATFERAFKAWQGVTPVAMQSRFACLAAEHNLESVITAESIPTPPVMLVKLVGLIGDDDFHMDELAELVESDPVLTSKVLSIANSVIYGYSGITSVKQAILKVLGIQKLQALVITILSADALPVVPNQFPYDAFWYRAISTAQLTALFSQAMEIDKNQQFPLYIAALLHNIGHLGMAYCLTDGYTELVQEDMNSLTWIQQLHLQKLRVGIHSVQVSEMLLNLWNFPPDVIKALRESGAVNDFIEPLHSDSNSPLSLTFKLQTMIENGAKQAIDLSDVIDTFLLSYGESIPSKETSALKSDILAVLERIEDTDNTLV